MKNYFRFVGITELIVWFIGIIGYFIGMGKIHEAFPEGWVLFLLIIGLLIYVILGPAIGLLFISHAELMPDPEASSSKVNDIKPAPVQPKNNVKKVLNIGDQVAILDPILLEMYHLSNTTVGTVERKTDKGYLVSFPFGNNIKTLDIDSNQLRKVN